MSESQPKQAAQKPANRAPKLTPSTTLSAEGQAFQPEPLAEVLGRNGQLNTLPSHSTSKQFRQASVLRMQRRQGNGYVQRFLRNSRQAPSPQATNLRPQLLQLQDESEDAPGEEQKAAATAAAQAAEGSASQAASQAQDDAGSTRAAAGQEAGSQSAQNEAGALSAGSPAHQSGPGFAAPQTGEAQSQSSSGEQNPAAGASPAQAAPGSGEHAPTSPQEDEGFLSIVEQIRQKAGQQKGHPPAEQEAKKAQDAAESPASEAESKAKAGHVRELESVEEPAVDKAGLKAQLMQKIQALAPSTAQEADQLKSSGRLGGLKAELQGKMAEEKSKSIGPMKEKSEAAPSQAGITPKPVKPLSPPESAPPMQQFNAAPAVPKPKPAAEIEKPLKEESKSLDQQMAEAEITEEQLKKSNEPEFQAALESKREAQLNANEAPQKYRQDEQDQIALAREEANTSANQELQGMQDIRQASQNQVGQEQGQAKSADEAKRQEVADTINGIYDKTKANVDRILNGLDAKVNPIFEAGAAAAQAAFESFVAAKMEAYKQNRYGGVLGWARWAKDKLLGMPPEVNQFYMQGRERYLAQMDAVIDSVVAIIASTLGEAKSEVARGKAEIHDYVNQLPAELRQIGQEAASEIQGRFDELERQIDQAQQEVIDHLAQRYAENLQVIDARVEAMQAQNQGLLQAAAEAIRGVVQTIAGLKQRLLSLLSRVASAVGDIMRDPVGFLGNLLSAVKSGLMNFVGNIATHLRRGLVGWLFRALEEAGIELPDSFDLQGVMSMVMRVLGLTWESIRSRLARIFGGHMVGILENVFDVIRAIKSEGIGALFRFVQDRVANIKDTVLAAVRELVGSEIVQAGIQKLISLIDRPASAFIQAVENIYDVIGWVIGNGGQIFSLVQAIMTSITSIVSGSIGGAAELIEQSLARSIPAVVGFLAKLLGLGDIGRKVVEIIRRVREPVDAVIDWLIDRARGVVGDLVGESGGEEGPGGAGAPEAE